MNLRLKSIVILVATLGVGVFTGASITGALVRSRLEYVRSFGQTEGFVESFTELIGPMSEEQREEIEPLLIETGSDINALIGETHREFRVIVSRLDDELSKILTAEQFAAMQEKRAGARNLYFGRFAVAPDEAP